MSISIKNIIDNPDALKVLLDANVLDVAADGQALFVQACEKGYETLVGMLLNHPDVDPTGQDNLGFCKAAAHGHLAIVKLLLKNVGPIACNNGPLQAAVRECQPDVVEVLLKDERVTPTTEALDFYRWFHVMADSEDNHAKQARILKMLLDDGRYDPTYNDQATLVSACTYGRADLVKLFLADNRIDPSLNDSKSLERAMYNIMGGIVAALLADGRADPTFNDGAGLREALKDAKNGVTNALCMLDMLIADERVPQCDAYDALAVSAKSSGNYALAKLFKKKKETKATTTTTQDVNVNLNVHVYVHQASAPQH